MKARSEKQGLTKRLLRGTMVVRIHAGPKSRYVLSYVYTPYLVLLTINIYLCSYLVLLTINMYLCSPDAGRTCSIESIIMLPARVVRLPTLRVGRIHPLSPTPPAQHGLLNSCVRPIGYCT